MAADALIFDLDGTVWDSAQWFARALADGDPHFEEQLRSELRGTGNIVRISQRLNISKGKLVQRALQLSGAPPLFPGIADTLERLEQSPTPLGIATSLPGSLALPMLEAAGLRANFSTVVHAGVCRPPKPNPASINMALRDLGKAPGPNTFYIGDRASDAEAARRAGISFAWVAHGYEVPSRESGYPAVAGEDIADL